MDYQKYSIAHVSLCIPTDFCNRTGRSTALTCRGKRSANSIVPSRD